MDAGHRDPPASHVNGELTRAKTRVPRACAGSIERERLLEPLMRVDGTDIVVVRAPAGSGKTTLLAQWASVDRARDFAWVSLDETDDDCVTFWRQIVAALRATAPEEAAHATAAISRVSPDVSGAVVPAVLTGLADRVRPLVLVLDDFQVITDQACHESLRYFARRLAGPCTLAVSTRIEPQLNLAQLMIDGRARVLSEIDLAFTNAEVVHLLSRNGIRPSDIASRLLSDTDGWAAGVRLSILDPSLPDAHRRPTGQRETIREFLTQEVLDRMDPADRAFLQRCSVLTTLSPDLCGWISQTRGAGRRLAALSKSNVLITPIDHESQTYRLHQLLRDVLQKELGEDDPDRLHALAAEWFIDHDCPIDAVEHALRISTPDLAADTIASCWFETVMAGNLTTVGRWLDHFYDTDLRSHPFLLIAAAWTAGLQGDWATAWRYSRASADLGATGATPDGTASLESARALMLAGLGLDGIAETRTQAEIAYRLEGPDSRWRSLAAALLGAASLAVGSNDEARRALTEAATSISGPPGVATYAMGQLAILDASEQRWAEVERTSRQAIEEIEQLGLENMVSSGGAYVMHAAAAAHRGDLAIARRRLHALNPVLPSLSTAMPFDAFQVHLLAAEVHTTVGQQRAAATHTEAAQQHHELLPDTGVFQDRLIALTATASLNARTTQAPSAASSLTAREHDILSLLPSTLSLREIGDQLYVSRNTVKTYVTRIYRKLAVNSRSAAVMRAVELGLVPQPWTIEPRQRDRVQRRGTRSVESPS